MARAFFISDIHFGLESKEKELRKQERVFSFLDHVLKEGNELFIVGDLFDAWFEYRRVIPKGYHRLLTKLEDLTRGGVTVRYAVGNHDFWIRDFFRDDLGIETHYDPFSATVNGKRIYIHHGDGLAERDSGYRILKKILRNRFNVWLYSWVHPDIGLRLAGASSKKSRDYTATKDYGESDGMIREATAKIAEGFDVVVMGHRHRPDCRSIGGGTYVNLGDWITYNTYAEMADGTIHLKEWGA
jgi:UDP-2,3-diacylglucosamine hydrolase